MTLPFHHSTAERYTSIMTSDGNQQPLAEVHVKTTQAPEKPRDEAQQSTPKAANYDSHHSKLQHELKKASKRPREDDYRHRQDLNKDHSQPSKRPREDDTSNAAKNNEESRRPTKRVRESHEKDSQRSRDGRRSPVENRATERVAENQGSSRPRKRPGGASRISRSEVEAAQQRQIQRAEQAQVAAVTRGVEEVVRQHYNAVPQRGREWRKTDSRIKGLRSFNNWIKSTVIHKFSPGGESSHRHGLRVLDIGCGKGGDLQKWQQAPQPVELYVGIDPAEVSIDQARDRYRQMRSRGRGRLFDAEFLAEDAFAYSLGDLRIIREVGFGPGSRWGPSGGFDVVSMMFCMHYAFESEAKAKGMLANVSNCLHKGGRFLGVIPNSDVIRAEVVKYHKEGATQRPGQEQNAESKIGMTPLLSGDGLSTLHSAQTSEVEATEQSEEQPHRAEWGNGIYRVRFPGDTPTDGIFRPPYGHRYSYFLEEAVEEVPEYVVPWEAFRG